MPHGYRCVSGSSHSLLTQTPPMISLISVPPQREPAYENLPGNLSRWNSTKETRVMWHLTAAIKTDQAHPTQDKLTTASPRKLAKVVITLEKAIMTSTFYAQITVIKKVCSTHLNLFLVLIYFLFSCLIYRSMWRLRWMAAIFFDNNSKEANHIFCMIG